MYCHWRRYCIKWMQSICAFLHLSGCSQSKFRYLHVDKKINTRCGHVWAESFCAWVSVELILYHYRLAADDAVDCTRRMKSLKLFQFAAPAGQRTAIRCFRRWSSSWHHMESLKIIWLWFFNESELLNGKKEHQSDGIKNEKWLNLHLLFFH